MPHKKVSDFMYNQSKKMQYVHASIVVIRSQINSAIESKSKGDISMYNNIISMIRTELFFINLIDIVDYKNNKLLHQIVNNMLD